MLLAFARGIRSSVVVVVVGQLVFIGTGTTTTSPSAATTATTSRVRDSVVVTGKRFFCLFARRGVKYRPTQCVKSSFCNVVAVQKSIFTYFQDCERGKAQSLVKGSDVILTIFAKPKPQISRPRPRPLASGLEVPRDQDPRGGQQHWLKVSGQEFIIGTDYVV